MTGLALYDAVAYDAARRLTLRYSTSFGLASRLFSRGIRPHIYAIYGMVRVADEIVDTYAGADQAELLASFEADVAACVAGRYSANPIVHAFGIAARRFGIGHDLINPFFASMRADLIKTSFTTDEYDAYVYGSAEVVGLMCLKVFCDGDADRYAALAPGARLLGSAYQKVNFVRDFGADLGERGRVYFPGVTAGSWNDTAKTEILDGVTHEFEDARRSIRDLPRGARTSVYLSYSYYTALLKRLQGMSAADIRNRRAHVPAIVKLGLLLYSPLGARA